MPLWADAICIDQEDDDEKELQVAKMAKIYRMAKSVQVWLGDATPSDRLAFSMIQCVADYLYNSNVALKNNQRSFAEHFKCWIADYDAGDQDQMNRFGFLDVGDCFKATTFLSRKPWFHRLWVIQEIAVARKAYFRCGRLIIDLSELLAFARFNSSWCGSELDDAVFRDDEHIESTRIFQRLQEVVRGTVRQDPRRENIGRDDGKTPAERLWELLPVITQLNTSDQRDMIYATRELVAPGSIEYFPPRYSPGIPVAQLWRDVADFLIKAAGDPFIESQAILRPPEDSPKRYFSVFAVSAMQRDSRIPQLSSWIPDLGAMNSRCVAKLVYYLRESGFYAAGGPGPRAFNFLRVEAYGVLRTIGHLLGQVDNVLEGSSCPLRNIGVRAEVECLYDYFVTLVKWRKICASFMIDNSTVDLAVPLGTLLLQGVRIDTNVPSDPRLDQFDSQRALRRMNIDDIDFPDAGRAQLLKDIEPFFRGLGKSVAIDHLDTTRILARTSDRRVGWVPQHTKPGDLVALIRGAPFPFILRRADDEHYTIVGDAYIVGIMQGEACPKADNDWVILSIK